MNPKDRIHRPSDLEVAFPHNKLQTLVLDPPEDRTDQFIIALIEYLRSRIGDTNEPSYAFAEKFTMEDLDRFYSWGLDDAMSRLIEDTIRFTIDKELQTLVREVLKVNIGPGVDKFVVGIKEFYLTYLLLRAPLLDDTPLDEFYFEDITLTISNPYIVGILKGHDLDYEVALETVYQLIFLQYHFLSLFRRDPIIANNDINDADIDIRLLFLDHKNRICSRDLFDKYFEVGVQLAKVFNINMLFIGWQEDMSYVARALETTKPKVVIHRVCLSDPADLSNDPNDNDNTQGMIQKTQRLPTVTISKTEESSELIREEKSVKVSSRKGKALSKVPSKPYVPVRKPKNDIHKPCREEMNRMKKEHAQDMTQMKKAHNKEIKSLKMSFQRQIDNLVVSHNNEIAIWKAEVNRWKAETMRLSKQVKELLRNQKK